MNNIPSNGSFEQITSQTFLIANAPAEITLPKELVEGMQSAWDNSLPKGQSQEQGGILVRNDDGYEWKAGKPGTSGGFIPNYGDVDKNETLVAIGHTHPYDQKEGGYTNVSFSGRDLAITVYQTQSVNIVQSGQTLFVVARSAEFNKLVKKLDFKGKKDLFQKVEQTWDQIFFTTKGRLPECADAATKATTEKYQLAYYKGNGNLLKKVDSGDKSKIANRR